MNTGSSVDYLSQILGYAHDVIWHSSEHRVFWIMSAIAVVVISFTIKNILWTPRGITGPGVIARIIAGHSWWKKTFTNRWLLGTLFALAVLILFPSYPQLSIGLALLGAIALIGKLGSWPLAFRTVIAAFMAWEIAFLLLAFGVIQRTPGSLEWIPGLKNPTFAAAATWGWTYFLVLVTCTLILTALIRVATKGTKVEAEGKALIGAVYTFAFILFVFCPVAATIQSGWATHQDTEEAYAKDPQPFSPDVTNTYILTENTSPFFKADRPTKENEYWFCATHSGTIEPVWLQKGVNLYRAYSPKGSVEIKYRMLPEKDYPAGCPDKLPS